MEYVESIMSGNVQTIAAHEQMSKAAQTMSDCGIRHLVVVDANGRPAGVFSERDVLRYLVRTLNNPTERPKDVSAVEIASTGIVTVSPDSPVCEAAAIMSENKVGCLPVLTEDGQLVGIITAVDVLGHMGKSGSVKEEA